MTDSDPLTALHHWFAGDHEERLRLVGSDPGTDAEQLGVAVSLHRLEAAGAATLLELVGPVLDPPEQYRAGIQEWVGLPLLESLRRAAGQVDVDEVDRVRGAMRVEADAQESAGVADYGRLRRQGDELHRLTEQLRSIVRDIYVHLEEKAAADQLSAIEEAARQVPGSNVRITEMVAGPDGMQHVVRDVMALGPDPDLAHVNVNYSMPQDRRQLLGVDDRRQAELAGQRVQHLRGTRALTLLGLPETASTAMVQDRAIGHLLARTQVDAEIGDVLGDLPAGLVGLMPGHLPALRASAMLMLVDAIQDAAARGRRGDQVVGASGSHMLLVGLALVHGTPFHLPVAMVPTEEVPPGRFPALPPGDIVVFHDRPLQLGEDAAAIAWLFTVDDDRTVMDFGQVLLEVGDDDTTGIEVSNVNLARGPAAAVAARVLAGVALPGWQVATKRKPPGRPGNRIWRNRLGRGAATELRTGSLAAVRTRGEDSTTP